MEFPLITEFGSKKEPSSIARNPSGRVRRARLSQNRFMKLLPERVETWLLVPVPAPDTSAIRGPRLVCIGQDIPNATALDPTSDAAAAYNIIFRFLFDRHRDMPVPTSFLIDSGGDIVKVYQGAISAGAVANDISHLPTTAKERIAKALPFPGVSTTYEFARNYLSYGSVFFQRGYFAEAGTYFRLAVRDDPASAEALYSVGSAALKLGDTAAARDNFERAAKLPGSYLETRPNALNNLGLLATREARTEEALKYFQEAVQLHPEHVVGLKNLGNAFRQLKRWDEAKHSLERALTLDPEDPELHYSLGMVFAQTGDSLRAYESLSRALELRPAYPEALNNLGILYLRTQRRDEAVAVFEECIRVAPEFDQSYLNLAAVHRIEGHPDQARSVLAALLKQHPEHAAGRKAMEELR